MNRRPLLAVLAASFLLTACIGGSSGSGGPASPTPGPSGSGPGPGATGEVAAGLLVSITEVGGFVAPVALQTRFPDIAIYADGRMIQPGATPAIFPGPLLPSLLQSIVTPAGLQRVMDLARTDGLTDHPQSYPANGVADMPDTLITVVVNGQAVMSRFGGLGAGTAATDPTEAAARAKAQDFIAKLTGYPSLFAAGEVGQAGPFVPDALEIVAVKGDPSAQVQPSQLVRQPVAWPLATPLSAFGTGAVALPSQPSLERCGVVTGADLSVLWPLLQQATQITGFSSAGMTWTLTPRPLLPGEPATCPGRTDQLQATP